MKPLISVAIPTYEMGGNGHKIIEQAFYSLSIQKFKKFEVVISDQSEDNKTKETCQKWSSYLDIVYLKYPFNKGCYTANTNNAIKACSGKIIKYLDADDFLYDENSLQSIYETFEPDTIWIASDYVHTTDGNNRIKRHSPQWHPQIYLYNTIGSPSGVAIRKKNIVLMDEQYRWMGDADLYMMIYKKWGEPKILRTITAVHYLWEGQTSNVLNELQWKEVEYAKTKYEGTK